MVADLGAAAAVVTTAAATRIAPAADFAAFTISAAAACAATALATAANVASCTALVAATARPSDATTSALATRDATCAPADAAAAAACARAAPRDDVVRRASTGRPDELCLLAHIRWHRRDRVRSHTLHAAAFKQVAWAPVGAHAFIACALEGGPHSRARPAAPVCCGCSALPLPRAALAPGRRTHATLCKTLRNTRSRWKGAAWRALNLSLCARPSCVCSGNMRTRCASLRGVNEWLSVQLPAATPIDYVAVYNHIDSRQQHWLSPFESAPQPRACRANHPNSTCPAIKHRLACTLLKTPHKLVH